MNSNKKFVILLEILLITFLVISVVPVCGLSDSSADISAYPSIVNPGDEITVTYSGAPGFEWDWIGLYKVGDPNEWFDWGYYLGGEKSGSLIIIAPQEPGDYEFRLFEDDGYTDIARSNIVTVQEGTTPTSEEAIVLFDENFDDGFAPRFGNEVGDWEVHLLYPYTGKYTATTGTFRFSMAGDTNWQDYVIEADFFNAQDGGLLVRAQDQDNCIALIVRPASNEIGWNVRKGGSWGATGLEVATLGHEPGEELHVKVEVTGSEFKAYVNGVLKTTLNTTEYPNGKIGLYLCKQSDQYWDNVVVCSSGAAGSTPTTLPPTAEAGLVAYYTFDGDTLDHSENGNDGTNHGATFVSGISGQALSFDGKDDYVQVPDSPSLDIASNNITLSAWVYFPEFVPGYGTIIEKTGSGGWNRYGVFSKNGKLSFLLYKESIEAHTAVSANQWVHFVATYDGINMKIYINGALDVEREQPGIDIKENNMPLMIGADPFGDGHYDHILIDEVKIYNYALSADEIKALYEEKEPSAPTPTPPPIDSKEAPVTVLTSSTILPTAGGLLTVESEDNVLNGASLDIPARALTDNVMISIATTGDLPSDSPFGQVPVGKLFVLVPSDLTFSAPVTLTLPIPAGEERQGLYIGRWDDKNKTWENIGGTIEGDFIATNISHLSFYGVFYSGKSTVQIVNKQELDITDLPITVLYVAGPVPPLNTVNQSPFRATRPLPPGGVQLKQDESRIMQLLPGRYHFLVSYPRPQPGVANSMWFTIPALTEGADDGQIDQTIAIRDYGAESTNSYTNDSIMFPGRTVVVSTNFRPAINVGAIVPAGVPSTIVPVNPAQIPPLVSQLEYGSNQILNIGPIKIEQLQDEGITLSATATDPGGLALKYYWTVPESVSGGSFAPGTAASGSTVTAQFKTGRAGLYIVYLTIYNNVGLFNEGRWAIVVIPNANPYIDVVVDDRVVDFGRLDDQRRNNPMIPLRLGGIVGTIPPGRPNNHPQPFPADDVRLPPRLWGPIPNWGVYVTPPVLPAPRGVVSSTELKRIVPAGVVPDDPTQYPQGMTCVYAIVADADADLIDAKFVLPAPIFYRGNFYTAIPLPYYPIGTLIDSYGAMVNYNAMLTEYANRGWLPCQPHARTPTLPNGNPNPLLPFVAPTGVGLWTYTDVEPKITHVFTKPVRGEFPYVIAFNGGNDPQGRGIQEGDVVTEALNPWGLIPQGTVHKVIVVEGSWAAGDAKGYLWMIPVTDDFWDQRNPNPFATVPALFVGATQETLIATCSFVGQTLPVIWEAPDDPDAGGQVRDRRLIDPDTIPLGGMLNIEARVRDSVGTQKRAFAWVAWPTPVEEEKEADLKITKNDSPDPVLAGNDLTYTLTVTNNGPSDATEVVVTDTLPSDVTFVSATPSQRRATESAGVVTWNVGDLVSGASATLTIVVTVSSSAEDDSTLTNTASVSAAETDPNTADNSDMETTTINKEDDEDEEEVTTTPSTVPTITIPSGVHHLGDQNIPDWEVPKAEGTEYKTTFTLATVPARAYLILEVFQTDYDDPVLVNGHKVGFLCLNKNETWIKCIISIPGSDLKKGSNTLTIRSGTGPSGIINYDDFMIRP